MTAIAEREYTALLTKRPLRVLRSKVDYNAALKEIDALLRLGDDRSEAQSDYYELLATLIGDYDRKHVKPLTKLAPLEFLKEAMDLEGIPQAKLGHLLGRAAASAILNGQRQISKTQAKKLAEFFGVDAGVFI